MNQLITVPKRPTKFLNLFKSECGVHAIKGSSQSFRKNLLYIKMPFNKGLGVYMMQLQSQQLFNYWKSMNFNSIQFYLYRTIYNLIISGWFPEEKAQSLNLQVSKVVRKNSLLIGRNLEQHPASKEEPSCWKRLDKGGEEKEVRTCTHTYILICKHTYKHTYTYSMYTHRYTIIYIYIIQHRQVCTKREWNGRVLRADTGWLSASAVFPLFLFYI